MEKINSNNEATTAGRVGVGAAANHVSTLGHRGRRYPVICRPLGDSCERGPEMSGVKYTRSLLE